MSKKKLTGDEIRSAKKAAILNEKKRSRLPLIAVALCAVFIAAGSAMYTLTPFGKGDTAATTGISTALPGCPLSV